MRMPTNRGCKPRALAAAIGLALAASGAQADTFSISSTDDAGPGTLRQAIIDANGQAGPHTLDFSPISGQTITLAADLPLITEDMTLQGSEVTLSGDDNHSCLDVDGVRLAAAQMTITRCSSPGYGGGVFIINGELDLNEVTITDSAADGGGGVAAVFSEVAIANSTISSNEAANTGGGVYLYDSRMMLTNSTISGNGGGQGSAVFGYYGSIANIIDSTISANHSAGGGAIFLQDASLRLLNSTVSGNSTDADAGYGVFALGSDALIAGSTIADNTGNLYGGVGLLFAYSGGATIVNSTISGNDRGGVRAYQSALTLIDSTVSGNGGAAYSLGGVAAIESESVILASTIADNQAEGYVGGGVHLEQGWALVEESVISGNEGSFAGGLFADDTELYLLDTEISNNQAAEDGGLLVDSSGVVVHIDRSTTSGNYGAQFEGGGAVFAYGQADVVIRNTTVSGNQAGSQAVDYTGGLALYVGAEAQALLDGVTVTGNQAQAGESGGLYVFNAPTSQATVRNSIIAGNTASGSRPNLSGQGADISYTLIGDPTVSSGFTLDAVSQGLLGANPALGPLADNGGFTLTHLPGASGAGLNVIPVGVSGCGGDFSTDQRGRSRPGAGTDHCDLGSVELMTDLIFKDRFQQ